MRFNFVHSGIVRPPFLVRSSLPELSVCGSRGRFGENWFLYFDSISTCRMPIGGW